MNREIVYKFFTDDDFLRFSEKISEMEKQTAGEIRVSIKDKKPLLKKNKNLHELAQEEFFNLGMDKTRDKTGILIYIVLTEKSFTILADSGINEKVNDNTWDKVRDEMQEKFREGRFAGGILTGIERVGKILTEYFPVKPDDTNELSNRIIV